MILHKDLPFDRFYEPKHMAEVWDDMLGNFDRYFKTFAHTPVGLAAHFNKHITEFLNEQESYQPILDIDFLYECDEDPGTYKNIFKAKYPIIRRCLNSRSKLMDGYRRDFYQTSSEDILNTAINIIEFAQEYIGTTTPKQQAMAKTPEDLGVSILDEDGYGTSGVIGGGIRSAFLYHVDPGLFPNRNQGAIWAFYFLTDRKDYGFEDYSEFLMIDSADASRGTQQNYFYPYDLFTWYGLQLCLKLDEVCQPLGYTLLPTYRYVYLDAFLGHIARTHEVDINTLRPQFDEQIYH
ncbi:MAG: hypothetical protein KDJ52_26985 [Anaerolineae bacterium]|nr:hypothetical protein [Anaerolineae bacterium]MCB0213018.1 hypothetical protein [Anaerolineae bacterium]